MSENDDKKYYDDYNEKLCNLEDFIYRVYNEYGILSTLRY